MDAKMSELGLAVQLADEAKELGLRVTWSLKEWAVIKEEDVPPEGDGVMLNKILFQGTELTTLKYLLWGMYYGKEQLNGC